MLLSIIGRVTTLGEILNNDAAQRYSRQILFPPIGEAGQRQLASSHVAIIGCGALGSAQAALLTRAGVGVLTLIDRDYVEVSNLQRQILFTESDAADSLPKAVAAANRLRAANSAIEIRPVVDDLTSSNIQQRLAGAAVLLDATDNLETRYLLNDFAIHANLPWIYGAVVGSYGVTFTVIPGQTACLECIFGDRPAQPLQTCDTAGVVNWAVNLIASMQAGECVKLLVGARSALRPTLFAADMWKNEFQQIQRPARSHNCRACARRDFVYLRGERKPQITLCGRDSVQIHERERAIDFAELERRLAPHGLVRQNGFVLKFWTGAGGAHAAPSASRYELTVFPDGRAIVKGTSDPVVARSLYARFVGV